MKQLNNESLTRVELYRRTGTGRKLMKCDVILFLSFYSVYFVASLTSAGTGRWISFFSSLARTHLYYCCCLGFVVTFFFAHPFVYLSGVFHILSSTLSWLVQGWCESTVRSCVRQVFIRFIFFVTWLLRPKFCLLVGEMVVFERVPSNSVALVKAGRKLTSFSSKFV